MFINGTFPKRVIENPLPMWQHFIGIFSFREYEICVLRTEFEFLHRKSPLSLCVVQESFRRNQEWAIFLLDDLWCRMKGISCLQCYDGHVDAWCINSNMYLTHANGIAWPRLTSNVPQTTLFEPSRIIFLLIEPVYNTAIPVLCLEIPPQGEGGSEC